MAKHTLGPWHVAASQGTGWLVYSNHVRGARADNTARSYVAFNIENESDARLIAEVPAMLEALWLVAEALGNGATINDRKNSVYGDMLRAILARIDGATAEGGEVG